MKFIVVLLSVVIIHAQAWKLNYANATQISSPNFDHGRQNYAISCLVLHGTAGDGAVARFKNSSSKASAHYVIEQNGTITQMVSENDTAWHTGAVKRHSEFYGRASPDLWCIGIQFSRNIQNNNTMPSAQLSSGVKLIADIKHRYKGINIYTHSQFNNSANCPGPNFPLSQFQNA